MKIPHVCSRCILVHTLTNLHLCTLHYKPFVKTIIFLSVLIFYTLEIEKDTADECGVLKDNGDNKYFCLYLLQTFTRTCKMIFYFEIIVEFFVFIFCFSSFLLTC